MTRTTAVNGTVECMTSQSPRLSRRRRHCHQTGRSISYTRGACCVFFCGVLADRPTEISVVGCPLSMHASLRLSLAHKAVASRPPRCRRRPVWSAALPAAGLLVVGARARRRGGDTKRHSADSISVHIVVRPSRYSCCCCCCCCGGGGELNR